MAKQTAKSTKNTKATKPAPDDIILDEDDELAEIEAALEGDTTESTASSDMDDIELEEDDLEEEVPVKKAKSKSKPAKKAAKDEEKPKTGARPARFVGSTVAETILGRLGEKADDYTILTMDQADDPADKRREKFADVANSIKAKKVGEKAINLFEALGAGRRLSNYTVLCARKLFEEGTVTSTDLVGTLSESYSDGTARSQAQQMMTLFSTFGIAEKKDKALVVNTNSVLGEALKEIVKTPAAA